MTTLKKIACALTLVTATSTSYADSMPGKGVSVVPVQSAIAEESFQTIVLNEALKQLGYDVQPIKEVDYSAGYTSIANEVFQKYQVNNFESAPLSVYPLHLKLANHFPNAESYMIRINHYLANRPLD